VLSAGVGSPRRSVTGGGSVSTAAGALLLAAIAERQRWKADYTAAQVLAGTPTTVLPCRCRSTPSAFGTDSTHMTGANRVLPDTTGQRKIAGSHHLRCSEAV
jgi:hypothetical protein